MPLDMYAGIYVRDIDFDQAGTLWSTLSYHAVRHVTIDATTYIVIAK